MTRLILQSSQIIRAKVELIQPKKRNKTEIPNEDDLIVESLFLDEWLLRGNRLDSILKSLGDSIVDDISPKDAEDEGTGCKEVEDGDFDPTNHERKAEYL